jgi:hypothetical protein
MHCELAPPYLRIRLNDKTYTQSLTCPPSSFQNYPPGDDNGCIGFVCNTTATAIPKDGYQRYWQQGRNIAASRVLKKENAKVTEGPGVLS